MASIPAAHPLLYLEFDPILCWGSPLYRPEETLSVLSHLLPNILGLFCLYICRLPYICT